jgi:hypothetical protein
MAQVYKAQRYAQGGCMIVKTFDNGWGNNFPAKKFEQNIVNQYLKDNKTRSVLINNTWYTKDYHQQVMSQLRTLEFDQIVLISMLDASIASPDWYQEFDRPVHAVGYYPGKDNIDFWALMVDQYFDYPNIDLLDSTQIDTAYLCLNRKPHWHRQQLYSQLVTLDIVDQGIVSMGGDNSPAQRTLPIDAGQSNLAPNAGPDQNGIANDIMSLGHPSNWSRCFLNVVTETQFDIATTYFVSEKIYKPIVGCRPFLVYAKGADTWLLERGFEPYTKDFQDISDLDLSNPRNTAEFLTTLCKQDSKYWQAKYVALQDKIVYNKTHFAEYVQQQKLIVEKGIKCQI